MFQADLLAGKRILITIDGGEWLKGAGEFNFVGDMMTEEDRAARRRGG